jgi:hypothetical protein
MNYNSLCAAAVGALIMMAATGGAFAQANGSSNSGTGGGANIQGSGQANPKQGAGGSATGGSNMNRAPSATSTQGQGAGAGDRARECPPGCQWFEQRRRGQPGPGRRRQQPRINKQSNKRM